MLRILRDPATGIVVDLHQAAIPEQVDHGPALAAMTALESGSMANADEQRRVGHYWLRAPSLAPDLGINTAITDSWSSIEQVDARGFDTILQIGIGGSALGPELVIDALGNDRGRRFVLLDTVDPPRVQKVLESINPEQTLVIVASKSGGTQETMTALGIVEAYYAASGLCFDDHALAVTDPDSSLANRAKGWRATLPVWDWVGGRTSITSAVGLLPMHLCGIDFRAFLAGAASVDAWTRQPPPQNPAAQLAALWASAGHHTAAILPYCDHLRVLGRYLQQLVMESLGKSVDRSGATQNYGLSVLGNKGSADQHALVQQLRDGPTGVINHVIHVGQAYQSDPLLKDASDLQFALMTGTQQALAEVDRPVVSIGLPELDAARLGGLIALFERVVGLTAELKDINAYHQPGVEAGKREAKHQLTVLNAIYDFLNPLHGRSGSPGSTADEIGNALGIDPAIVWRLSSHLSQSGRIQLTPGKSPSEDRFQAMEKSTK